MNVRAIAATAALAAAAVALSACSPTDTTAGSPVGPDRVITTAGQTPEATAAARRAAPPANDWIDVEKSVMSAPADITAAGAYISVGAAESRKGCTMGTWMRGADTAREGFTLAAHCGALGPEVRLGSRDGALLGRIGDTDKLLDSAVVWSTAHAPRTAAIAGLPIAGVMTAESVRELPKGTPICIDGATSDVVCAPLDGADAVTFTTSVATAGGDSGSTVFIVDGSTHAATLIGIAIDGDAAGTYAVYLDQVLDQKHLNAVAFVDPLAAESVAGDPRYSHRVAPLN